jgi:hypothetical protein
VADFEDQRSLPPFSDVDASGQVAEHAAYLDRAAELLRTPVEPVTATFSYSLVSGCWTLAVAWAKLPALWQN